MRWLRRRSRSADATPAPLVPALRVERALVALAVQAQQLDDRLDHIERRIDTLAAAQAEAPTHDDLLDARLHTARVAAELARISVELRAEIERTARELAAPPTERERRIRAIAETVIDLSDRTDTLPGDLHDHRPARALRASGTSLRQPLRQEG